MLNVCGTSIRGRAKNFTTAAGSERLENGTATLPHLHHPYVNSGLLGLILLYAGDTALYYASDTPEELEMAMQGDALALHNLSLVQL